MAFFKLKMQNSEAPRVGPGLKVEQELHGGRFGKGGGVITPGEHDSQFIRAIASTIRATWKHDAETNAMAVEFTPQVPLRLTLVGFNQSDERRRDDYPSLHVSDIAQFNYSLPREQQEHMMCSDIYDDVVNDTEIDSQYDLLTNVTAVDSVPFDGRHAWQVFVGLRLSDDQEGAAHIVTQIVNPEAPTTGNWFGVDDNVRVVALGIFVIYECAEHGHHTKFEAWQDFADRMPRPDGSFRSDPIGSFLDMLAGLDLANREATPADDHKEAATPSSLH